MKFADLNKTNKMILSIDDIADIFSISTASAKVSANRYVNKNYLIRLKNNFYITADNFEKLKEQDLFYIANLLQVPSYVSLTTALSFYNVSTQQLRGTIESIAQKRTRTFNVREYEFKYYLCKKNFYTGFKLSDNFFIATPEKALADTIYLASLKRYSCDFDAIDFDKINKPEVNKFIKITNKRTIDYWAKLCNRFNL